MNITQCPTEERPPVLALLRKTKTKSSGRKWIPDSIVVTVRVGEVIPVQDKKKQLIWKWQQVANHAEFTGPLAYESAKEFARIMKSGATLDAGETCNMDKGAMAKDAPLWRKIEAVEVVS